MSGDKNSFTMPGKQVKICALEGSVVVKFQREKGKNN